MAVPAHAGPQVIPGDAGPPLIGYTLHQIGVVGDPLEFVRSRWKRYGEVSWMHAFGCRWITLLGPDANQFVYQNRGDVFSNAAWNHFLRNFFHRGLMLLDGEVHRLHRRIMQSAFKRDALEGYVRTMGPMVNRLLRQWQPARRFLALPHFKQLTLDVASKVFMDEEPGAEMGRVNRAFLDTVRAPTDILRLPIPGTRWQKGLQGRRYLEQFFRQRLPAHRASQREDLFSRLCHACDETGALFSDDDVVNHMIFLMMAAHDTSTITLTNMTYQLARHPHWQERLRDESRTLDNSVLEYDDLCRLPAMDLVMKEALRLCAPVPGMPRQVVRDCAFKGFPLRAGDRVQLTPWFTHYMEDYWTDPDTFDPERFSLERAEDRRHPFQWVPFGGGAHKCIGLHFGELEIRQVMHQLLLHFRWSVPDGYEMQQDFTSLPVPKDRLPIRLERL